MPVVEAAIGIPSPARPVFALLRDVRRWPDFIGRDLEVLDSGETAGRAWAMVALRLKGVRLKGEARVEDVVPDRHVVVAIKALVPQRWTWELSESRGETRLSCRVEFEPPRWPGIHLAEELGRDGTLGRRLEEIVRSVKRTVEQSSAATAPISLAGCADYEPAGVRAAVRAALEPLGGIGRFVRAGDRVLLKPGLLCATGPGDAVTTHPAIVEAVAELVLDAGGAPVIADSPGSSVPYNERGLRGVYAATGLEAAARRTGAALNLDTSAIALSNPGGRLVKRFNLIRPAVEADVLINLPKLKTHVYTVFTGAVKNLFGLVPGYEKPGYHGRLRDRDRFAEMLLDLLGLVKPALSIMDGVIGLEGDGPGRHGRPRRVGVILAGTDPVAVDAAACRLVGIDPAATPVLAAAVRRGLWSARSGDPVVLGGRLEDFAVSNFRKPSISTDTAGYVGVRWLRPAAPLINGLLKRAFSVTPKPRPGVCTACRGCVRACPVGAASIRGGRAVMDAKTCIRCYCCHEQCAFGAIELKPSWLGRRLRAFGGAGS